MAVDIARFLSGIESPVARFRQGAAFGQQQADRRTAQEAAQAQAEQQKKGRAELLTLVQNEDRTPQEILEFRARNPEIAKTFQTGFDQLNTEAKAAAVTEATNVVAALSGGNTDAALRILEDRKEAGENSGDPQEVQRADILIQAIKADPKTALATASIFLAGLGEEGIKILEAITPKARAVVRPATPEEVSDLGLPEGTPGVQINTKTGRASIPGRGVTVRVGDRDKSALGKAASTFLTDVAEKGDASNELLNNADLLDQSLDKVTGTGFEPGIFSDIRVGLGRLAVLVGQGEGFVESIANAENIDAISQKLTILETQALKGSINKQEFTAAGKINTGLETSALGNRFAVKRMRAVGTMNDWRGQRLQELDDANPDASDKQLSRLLKKEFRGIPYISPTKVDSRGLPLFFTEFRNRMLEIQPDISTKELVDQWKAAHK